MFKPEKRKKSYDLEKYLYYVEWNPRAENVLKQMAKKGDKNRILKIKFVGSGKHTAEKIKFKKSRFFRWSFKRFLNPLRFKETVVDYRKNKRIPITVERIQEEFDEFVARFNIEVAETVIVDEIVWVDNLDNENWDDLSKLRYFAWMSRDVIKLKGYHRKAIPDLYDSGVYRPLVLSRVLRYDFHRDSPIFRIKSDKWRSADRIRFGDVADFMMNLWVDRGDIEAFLVDPTSREAELADIPISAKFDGQRVKFE